ncbi:MAG: HAMP domain-containing sensor histidine kinase, partial [Thalassolituus sp.]
LMKSFKSVTAGQIGDDSEWINLREAINKLLYSLSPSLRNSSHQITLSCPEQLSMQASPMAINQILTNLIMNSLNHGFQNIPSGDINIQVAEDRDNIVILYSDDGSGLTEEAKSKIFEPLFTTKRGKGGTGLGMHLVYNIVRQRMKGEITLEDSTEGVAFRIAIPKRKAQRREKGRQAIYQND